MRKTIIYITFALLASSSILNGQTIAVPSNIKAFDMPGDRGNAIILTWDKIPNENRDTYFLIQIAERKEGPYFDVKKFWSNTSFQSDIPKVFGFSEDNKNHHCLVISSYSVPANKTTWMDNLKSLASLDADKVKKSIVEGVPYFFRIGVIVNDEQSMSQPVQATATSNFFDTSKLNVFLFFQITQVGQPPPKMRARLGATVEIGQAKFFVWAVGVVIAEPPT